MSDLGPARRAAPGERGYDEDITGREINRIVSEGLERAILLVNEKSDGFRRLAASLELKETLDGGEISELVQGQKMM